MHLPIEVKLTDRPTARDAKHLAVFMAEYAARRAFIVVCTAPRAIQLDKHVTAIPWQELTVWIGKAM